MKRTKLLCVDNDPSFRDFYQALLGSCGYEVMVAGGGRQALKLFRSHEKDIAAVISDYEMPGMNGAELAAELKKTRPGVPVIMVSGCQPILEEAPHFVDAAISKGATMDEILESLKGVLQAQTTYPNIPLSRYIPLGSALASVAMAVMLGLRIWK